MTHLRVLLFGGPWRMSEACLDALAGAGMSVLLVTPPVSAREAVRRALGRSVHSIEAAARRQGTGILRYRPGRRFEAWVRRFAPDILCIATFPHLIPARISALARLGAVNLHPSLLPRHRGTQPLFWTYYHDDRETGLTVHRATSCFDAGPNIVQERVSLERGYPINRLATDLVTRSGEVLLAGIEAVLEGRPEQVQDDSLATRAPGLDHKRFRTPLEDWDVERTWHFLAGVADRYQEPLVDETGQSVSYHTVLGYERGSAGPARLAARDGAGWAVNCRNGRIFLA